MNIEQIYNNVLIKNGFNGQTIKAIEELSELIVELSKYLNGIVPRTSSTIVDEIADVSIMLDQLEIMFDGGGRVKERKIYKIQKLSKFELPT